MMHILPALFYKIIWMKKFKRIIWFIFLIIVLFFGAKLWLNFELSAVSSDNSTIIFVVDKGEGFSQVTDDLKKAKLIKNTTAFNIFAKQSGLGSKIQSGTFRLSPSQTSREILNMLTSEPLDNWVTLLEGWRVEEMAEALNSKFQIPNSKFIAIAKEGYMFPDTYLFPKDYSVEQIAKRLRDTFDLKYPDELKAKIRALGLTESQGVILASIVEREARSEGARTMVASILLKRFKIGMGLNADATVQYALGYQKDENPPAGGWWKKNLSLDDLKIDSPYNTYIHSGLPPTPICNPGLSSLTAVANADPSTPYLYYYHDSKGNSYYGKTLEEHNANVADHP